MTSLHPDDIDGVYQDDLSIQDYSNTGRIEGVELQDLRQMSDDGGSFLEVARAREGKLLHWPDFSIDQVNYSLMEPGAVKAWHLHLNQEDVWFIPPDSKLVVGLADCRKGSPTVHDTMRFVLGAGRARLLLIPRGVAHGVANMTSEVGRIIYFTNQHFNLDDPDERRLPWDRFGKNFWEMTRG